MQRLMTDGVPEAIRAAYRWTADHQEALQSHLG
jgi:hypothetical protein